MGKFWKYFSKTVYWPKETLKQQLNSSPIPTTETWANQRVHTPHKGLGWVSCRSYRSESECNCLNESVELSLARRLGLGCQDWHRCQRPDWRQRWRRHRLQRGARRWGKARGREKRLKMKGGVGGGEAYQHHHYHHAIEPHSTDRCVICAFSAEKPKCLTDKYFYFLLFHAFKSLIKVIHGHKCEWRLMWDIMCHFQESFRFITKAQNQ